jgi:hypothetical protein
MHGLKTRNDTIRGQAADTSGMANVGWPPAVGGLSYHRAEALTFFKEIEQSKPELLSFHSADKWEFVKGWLLNAGLIKP